MCMYYLSIRLQILSSFNFKLYKLHTIFHFHPPPDFLTPYYSTPKQIVGGLLLFFINNNRSNKNNTKVFPIGWLSLFTCMTINLQTKKWHMSPNFMSWITYNLKQIRSSDWRRAKKSESVKVALLAITILLDCAKKGDSQPTIDLFRLAILGGWHETF